jgi:uncharacterized membrane protein
MNATPDTNLPTTIQSYLAQVREALRDADPALVQDALYDAEEYLRSEMAEHPELDEAQVVAAVAGSYGAPAEVADIYRDTEHKVSQALRTPPAPPRGTWIGRFFGVATDARTYAALFYMLLSIATGIFYFTVAVTGVSLSAGLSILIIGVPFVILFVGIVRVLSLVEGRIVETMLGERMPRRPLYSNRGKPWLERIKQMFVDPRTWSTLLYMVLMLPLGIAYFTVVVTGLAISLSFISVPVAALFGGAFTIDGDPVTWYLDVPPVVALPLMFVLGVLLLFSLLHLARGVARVHGGIAKHLLVKVAQYS